MRLKTKGQEGFETQCVVAAACKRAKGEKTAAQLARDLEAKGVSVSPSYIDDVWRHILKKVRDAKPGAPLYKAKDKLRRLRSATARQWDLDNEFLGSKLCSEVDRLIVVAERGKWGDDKINAKWNSVTDSHKDASDEMKQMAKDKLAAFLRSRQRPK